MHITKLKSNYPSSNRFYYPTGIGVPRYSIASAERIAVENKGFVGLRAKNGRYRKVPKVLASGRGDLTFQKGLEEYSIWI